MKNKFFPPIIRGFSLLVFLLVIVGLNSCTKTSTSYYGYNLGWNGNDAYLLKVRGVWDRSSYYIDGERDDIADIGKMAVSAFELKRQAEIFARVRALFTFQERMEEYFNSIDKPRNADATYIEENNKLIDEDEEVFEEDQELIAEEGGGDESLATTIELDNRLIATNNEKAKIFYDDTNQNQNQVNQDPNQSPSTPAISESTVAASQLKKKTINFREVYDKVNLKITLIERIYTSDNDVDIIYLFSGKDLRQELAKAFNVSDEAIGLKL